MTTPTPPKFLDRTTPPHITTLVVLAAISAIPLNIFLASLPAMAAFFDVTYGRMMLAITGYLLLTGILQIFIGPLSDRYGRRFVTLISASIFILASIGAAFAKDYTTFMTFRILQAGISSGTVISRAIVRDMVGRERAASMIGYITMGMALAPMMSPALGGFLGAWLGWQANFHVLTIAGILTLALIYFDQGETNQNKSASFAAQFATYPTLLASRRFWGYAAITAFSAGSFFAYLGGAPFIGSNVYGLSQQQIGMVLMLTPFGYMTGNGISGKFSTRYGIARMMTIGGFCTFVPFIICMCVLLSGAQHPAAFFAFTFFIGFGNGLILPNANAGLLDVNPKLAGSASGLGGALMTLGGALFSAVVAFLLTEGSSAMPLVLCIIALSGATLTTVLFTNQIETSVRGDTA